jgi:type IV pilus assembly protein PilB
MQTRKRLGDLLVETGIISEEQLGDALSNKKEEQKLGDALVERGFISEHQLIEVLEFQLGIPHISLHKFPVDTSLLSLLSKETALRYAVIPIEKEDNELTVAMSDPLDYYTIDDLKLSTGFKIKSVIATKEEIMNAIHKLYNLDNEYEQKTPLDAPLVDQEAPAIKLVNQILQAGVQMKASDIHIDPHESKIYVRYRVDGTLNTERVLTKSIYSSLIARIKILGNLNITESRLPQDGRIKMEVDSTSVDLRISLIPTIHGEKVVIRILDLSNVIKKLSEIGFNKWNLQNFVKLIEKPSGLVLITGPTGSGKTSTLYGSLHHLNTEKVNIITVEDPVEYQLDGINQVEVNPQIGLDFAKGLRSILRQDPNIIMVGEIRDKETADIAVRSSLTGHLVLSTMHTNSAISTIPRLIDMGIEPYMVVSSLSGIVAQRLVRKLCKECCEEGTPTAYEQEVFKKRGLSVDSIFKEIGCSSCKGTGFKGRIAIHEILTLDDSIKKKIINGNNIQDIKMEALKKGMLFLLDDGLLKVKAGLTTIEEVIKVAVEE